MLSFFNTIVVFIIGYCVGSFPAGYFFTLFFSNADLRNLGSGTVGASNVGRILGPIGFLSVFLFDASKAYACLWFYLFFFSNSNFLLLMLSIVVVLGNVCSYGASYPRGKGVATALGCLLFFDGALFFVFVVVWIMAFLLWQIPTYASLIGLLISLLVSFYIDTNLQTRIFLIALHPILFYTHRIAIQKFLSGEKVVCYLKQLLKRLRSLKR